MLFIVINNNIVIIVVININLVNINNLIDNSNLSNNKNNRIAIINNRTVTCEKHLGEH